MAFSVYEVVPIVCRIPQEYKTNQQIELNDFINAKPQAREKLLLAWEIAIHEYNVRLWQGSEDIFLTFKNMQNC